MTPIKIMTNGLPGNVAGIIAKHFLQDDRFELLPFSLTGPEITRGIHRVESMEVALIRPEKAEEAVDGILRAHGPFITIDYTHPTAVNQNAQFYCTHGLPFIMGTTGGDRKALEDTVKGSNISAVIAPNMAKQIIGFQAMMKYAADTFPDLFKGYSLSLRESHQKGKADTSGTAVAMTEYFNRMGVAFGVDEIKKERNPEIQKSLWGVPEQYLNGHAWHTYTLTSQDQTVKFEFTHNINGREVYAQGTMDAAVFLNDRIKAGVRGLVFSMMDVMKKQ
ncbi:MAG: dihydrodipicolinate reductase [Desulfobacteraceae bacterium]|nr:dihydrodipicolinate reductase [Desulfobacteraceae bacterium]MBU4002016.1 dihydrodipicolinate reductase [Pseudomonadota bacterium]